MISRALTVVVFFCILATAAWGQPCSDRLVRSYGLGTLIGGIDCAAAFEDGAGASMFAAGYLRVGVQTASLVKMVGGRWVRDSAIGGRVTCMSVLDDGSGAALYIGGTFTVAPSTDTVNVARWNGSGWMTYPPISGPLGTGLSNPLLCLTWYDDGSGGKLYVGGSFYQVPGGAWSLARWDGQAWSAMPFAPSGGLVSIRTMLPYDDGTGLKLYVGGNLTSAGGVAVTGLATWDGSAWAAVGPGFASGTSDVYALAVHNDGTGPGLYAAGAISLPDRHNGTSPVAVWRDGAWSRVLAIGQGLSTSAGATALVSLSDANGPALYTATGSIVEEARQVRKFQNGAWSNVGPEFAAPNNSATHRVTGLLRIPGSGRLGAFGYIEFNAADLSTNTNMPPLAVWNGGGWFSAEGGALGLQSVPTVISDARSIDGRVYALGQVLTSAGWSVSSGPEPYPANGFVHMIYNGVDTTFTSNSSAVWTRTGGVWQPFPTPGAGVYKLVVLNDGAGEALYAIMYGSWPDGAGGTVTGARLERWNGSAWEFVGPVLVRGGSAQGLPGGIRAVAAYEDASGTHLYVGGAFAPLGSSSTPFLAKLDGNEWVAVDGLDAQVNDLLVYDVGSGPELIIAGDFAATAGTSNGIARWNGVRLWGLGTGMGGTGAKGMVLRIFDDGRGARLWAGSVNGSGLVYWDGAAWATPVSLIAPWFPSVTSLAEVNKPDGTRSLFIGGSFTSANNVPCNNIAELTVCRHRCTADFDGDGSAATDQDIEAFFACLAGNCCLLCGAPDFNNDGDTATDADIESFFRVLAGGAC